MEADDPGDLRTKDKAKFVPSFVALIPSVRGKTLVLLFAFFRRGYDLSTITVLRNPIALQNSRGDENRREELGRNAQRFAQRVAIEECQVPGTIIRWEREESSSSQASGQLSSHRVHAESIPGDLNLDSRTQL